MSVIDPRRHAIHARRPTIGRRARQRPADDRSGARGPSNEPCSPPVKCAATADRRRPICAGRGSRSRNDSVASSDTPGEYRGFVLRGPDGGAMVRHPKPR
jgi:hypothetical protein